MAVTNVSATNSTTQHTQQPATAKSNVDFAKVMASANTSADVKKTGTPAEPVQNTEVNKATA